MLGRDELSEVSQKHFQIKFIDIAIYCNTLFDIAIYRNTQPYLSPPYQETLGSIA